MNKIKKNNKEEKELARLLKAKNKPKFVGYIFFFLFVITIVYLTDEISTNIGKFLEIDVTNYFFGNQEAANASSIRALVTTLVSIIAGISMLFRPLADRYGRKLFLVIYTIGMGIGMGIIAIANHVSGWVIGTLMIQICIPHDMQQVYIQECVPKEKRGTYFFIIKGIATLGLMIVPLLKLIFKDINYNFKIIYGIVGAFGIISASLAALFLRESDVYLDTKIKELSMSEEEKEILKENKKVEDKKGGIISGFIYSIKKSQLRFLLIAFVFIMFSYVITDNYNTIMAVNYLEANNIPVIIENYEKATPFINCAIFTYPIGSGLTIILPGIISDKIGRKKGALIFGISTLLIYILFFIGSKKVFNPYLLGFLIGSACGCIWSVGDLVLLMVSESSVTSLRVSANAITLLLGGIMYFIGQTIVGSVGTMLGDRYLSIVTIIIVVIGLTIGLILLLVKAQETKGNDLAKI